MKSKMQLLYLFSLLIFTNTPSFGQALYLSALFENIDTLWTGGTPSPLSFSTEDVVPIIANNPCVGDENAYYGLATTDENTKVIVLAHEGILADNATARYDNLSFLLNSMDWLSSENKRVKFKNGWVNNANTSLLQTALRNAGYSVDFISTSISAASFTDTDVLILGNDWNNGQPYSSSELTAIKNFVEAGGGLLVTGLGWSWSGSLEEYPMNQVTKMFDIEFVNAVLWDEDHLVDDSPLLYTFYPSTLLNSTALCRNFPSRFLGTHLKRGDNLRIFRLAVSLNGEFTRQEGGIAASARLVDEWLAEINEMYGREYCVRFELVPNNDELIFDNPNTDPWKTLPASSAGCDNVNLIFDDQANVFNRIIGADNYDISHVILGEPFGYASGCGGGLNAGVSGGLHLPATRHEIGHQLGQSHTIANDSRSNYEPENGNWTVHGGNSYGYAHAQTYHELALEISIIHANKGRKVATNNTIPTADAGKDVFIPTSTPFTLTATAFDPDEGDRLTYVWDNMNRGLPHDLPTEDDTEGAIFMRLLPSSNANRTFPNIEAVLANQNRSSEGQLPTQTRVMDIRLTVNDNHKIDYEGQRIAASGINSDDIRITVADAGPFVVSSQNEAGIVYDGNSQIEVQWEVNGTDEAPISTKAVQITLSTDGGFTYPTTLVDSAANDGFASVSLPNISTARARIKVAALNSIYFNVNTHDFAIEEEIVDVNTVTFDEYHFSPNPTTGMLHVNIPIMKKVSIFNTAGELVMEDYFSENKLDLSDLSAGVYLIQFELGEKRLIERIVKL